MDRLSRLAVNERSDAARNLAEVCLQQASSRLLDVLHEESAAGEPVLLKRKKQVRYACPVERRLRVHDVLALRLAG